MAKTVKLNEETKAEYTPRKLSEIIADKKAALKRNEELIAALQTNEYEIPVGSPKLYKQIMKFLEDYSDNNLFWLGVNYKNKKFFRSLEEAIKSIKKTGLKTNILFSPGYPSGSDYTDFEQRGYLFNKTIKKFLYED